ncbi:MAG: GTPase domain-containing protein [Nitrospirae bacterium]|nr:GTPase domain-containing protein [Nitrospirota bacterium]
MVDEMNTILSDSSWWNASRRREAELRFSQPIVQAFFDEIQAGREDPESLREKIIRLPSAKEDGYSRVFFVGTTGAGKTSLLRQLIGSNPDRDRFPSTAPAKTTIADIEMIQAEGTFESVVTFFSEFHVQANIEECLIDACLAKFDGAPNHKVAERLLNHRDQKFRLSYVLGSLQQESHHDDDSDFSFDDREPEEAFLKDTEITENDRSQYRQVIETYLARAGQPTEAAITQLQSDLELDLNTASGQDREAARQLIEETIEEYLRQDEPFHELVQDILDEVRTRFDQVKVGEFHRSRGNWPEYWTFQSPDRDEFIRTIRWFSSNSWTQYGRLLTPLVEGIRVKGPLFPELDHERTKLVLIDGQGLGHTPDSSSSVTTHVTQRFGHVDVILLVDNAQQPMQAAALSVLRTVCSSGYHEKLAIAFTHFDLIKGHNLPSFADKRSHVMGSVTNALSNLKDVLGAPVVKAVEQSIEQRCFMLGGVDRPLAQLPSRAADYMKKSPARPMLSTTHSVP